MSSYEKEWVHAQGEGPSPRAEQAREPASGGQESVVFRSFNEACAWSRENAGRAFTRCANGESFHPVPESDGYKASQSWHDFEELYVDGPYRNEMG